MTLNLKLANNAKGTLAAGIGSTDVTIQLGAGQGALFPVITTGEDFFTVTATDLAGNHEIMVVTARAFDVLTVLRGQENTLARSFIAGTIVENRLTAGTFMAEVGRLQTLITTAITTFDPGPGADLTTANVKAVLLGALTTTELAGGLAAQIAKIDGTVSQIGSVNQRIKVETDNRVAAVQGAIDVATGFHNAEVGDRIAYVGNYAYSKNATDSAIAYQAGVTQAAYTAYADTAKTQAITLAAADVRTYSYAKGAVDSAIAQQSSIITAAYTAYADAKKGEAISTASADVRNYSYSQAQVNSAIAASETQLRSEFVSSGGVTQGYLSNYAYSKSDIDSSEVAQTNAITASYQSFATTKKNEAITAAAADVRSYTYSQAGVDNAISVVSSQINTSYNNAVAAAATDVRNYTFSQSAISGALNAQSSTLTANYQSYADAKKGEAIAAAAADVRNYTFSQATINGAFSSQTGAITAAYTTYADAAKNQAISTASADVRNYTYSTAGVNGAISSASNLLNARLDNAGGSGVTVESKLSATANAVTGLQGQASLTVDVNGVVTGIKATAGSGTSNLTFNAANVFFGAPGVTPRNLIGTGLVNGATRMVVLGDAIVDGGITARTLRIGSFDNIIPDPAFYDPAWWGITGESISHWADNGQATGWSLGSSLYLYPVDNVLRNIDTKSFPITPLATYKLEVQVNIPSNYNGNLGIYCLLPGVQFVPFTGGQDKGAFSDGLRINFDSTSPRGRNTYTATMTVPAADSIGGRAALRIRHVTVPGSDAAEIGSMSITRISDSTLIKDGAIITRHLAAESVTTDNLVANGVTVLDKFYSVGSALFSAPRNFKLVLSVYQEPIYTDIEGGPEGGRGWLLEAYTDQGSGNGYWTTLLPVGRSGQFSDWIDLAANTTLNPYYRVRVTSGSNLTIAIAKVYK